jgi:arginine decarboxylase
MSMAMNEKSMNVQPLSNPALYMPKAMFFTKGKGIHKDYLTSFELALRDAKISDLNIVSVSSIKPPTKQINRSVNWFSQSS